MARREVLEVTCDRCKRNDLQEKSQLVETDELVVSFRGQTTKYHDLCSRCREAISGYFKRMVKIEEEKTLEKIEKPVEPTKGKLSFLGGK